MKRLCAILGVFATAIVVTACGGGGTTTVIEKTVSTTPASSGSASTPQAALKAYDLAWAEGDAEAACELLVDSGRRAVETEMSNRTLGGLPLNCPERMEEVLQLLGPEAVAQLEDLASKVASDKLSENGDIAEITVNPAVFMELKKVDSAWYINGSTIKEIEPLVTKEEVEEYEAEEPAESKPEDRRETEAGIEELEEEGTVNAERQKRVVSETLGIDYHEPVGYVRCTVGVKAEPGKLYTCLAEMESGDWYEIKYRITDEAGDLSELRQNRTTRPPQG